jgi:hypothetical protein
MAAHQGAALAQLKGILSISDLNLGTNYECFEIDDNEVIFFATS